MAIEKLKNYISPGIDQIPSELIKAGGRTICCEIHKLIIYIWKKEELPVEWKESIIVPIYKKGDKTDCNNYRGISILPNHVQSVVEHPAFNVNSIYGRGYWESTMWMQTQ